MQKAKCLLVILKLFFIMPAPLFAQRFNWDYFRLKKVADSAYEMNNYKVVYQTCNKLIQYEEATAIDYYHLVKVCYYLNLKKHAQRMLDRSKQKGYCHKDLNEVAKDSFLQLNEPFIKKYKDWVLSHISSNKKIKFPALYDMLAERKKADQKYRTILSSNAYKEADKDSLSSMQGNEDRNNQQWLKTVVEEYGWPGFREVGEDGDNAAWLIVQHADDNVLFQKKMLFILAAAAQKQNTNPGNLAYLIDRIAINSNQLQIFGTQFSIKVDGRSVVLYPKPLLQPDLVNTLRSYYGLPSLETYLYYAQKSIQEHYDFKN